MGRLAPVVPSTDMTGFEDAYEQDPWCHCVDSSRPICGASGPSKIGPHIGTWWTELCSGCGKPNCPDCQQIKFERDR